MTIAAALLFTVLSSGAFQAPASLPPTTGETTATSGTSANRQQSASGITTSGDAGGRTAVSDGRQQQPRYDAPADEAGRPQMQGGVPGGAPMPPHARSLDSRHRIEVRFGGWGDGWYEGHGDNWNYAGSAKGAFGLEYLSFIRNDIGIGVGFSSLVRADDCHECLESGAARVVTSVPVIVRWYPVRRLTSARLVEPYVTGGIGPVFGVDTIYSRDRDGGWHHDEYNSTRVGTTFGGRVGGGVDFRLGRIFTLGVSGAWNWDSGFSNDLWRAERPSGGEFTVALGWNFGR